MKNWNKKIIISLLIIILTMVLAINVDAKSCNSINQSKTCNNNDGKCKWYNNKCYTLSNFQKKCNSDCEKNSKGEQAINKCKEQSCGVDTNSESKKRSECLKKCETSTKGSAALTACQKSCGTAKTSKVTAKSASSDSKLKKVTNVNFCASTAKVWKIVGIIFTIFKVVVPLILIIFGSIDLARAIFDGDDGITKAAKRLIFRVIAGIIIFLLPSMVTVLIGLFLGFSEDSGLKSDYEICKTCIVSPGSCDISKDASSGKTLVS